MKSKKVHLGKMKRIGGELFSLDYYSDENSVTAKEIATGLEIEMWLHQEEDPGIADLYDFMMERWEWHEKGIVFQWDHEYGCEQFLITTIQFTDDDIDTDIQKLIDAGFEDLLYNTDGFITFYTSNGNGWSAYDVQCGLD